MQNFEGINPVTPGEGAGDFLPYPVGGDFRGQGS